ncbi:hypothetical protein GW626_18725 [Peribacillus muralis]|uniref:NAD/NADP octopine/nopaline dehydrogenase family protein n=1 Tax=Peribacillus muralis TaxID=264697 RepID=UPI001F4D527E|nr:NAD/NADP octopine/nopaline dehydrogenase family protein [Peribacillus muralis]MCK1995146.1 NAD/NADP octopine/nopaline dehydrogenase family protein [Peribacillus muralis]MCK2015771.1 NAD/NADP octopine/nopaline dehydrogenase family protein [Peribacillus muralis]
MENITIIGGGNGAFAAASDLTIRGNKVTLFELPQFSANLNEVMERGGIELETMESNGLQGGFAKLHKITTNIEEALAASDIVMIVVPSYSMDTIATLCTPYLRDGQIIALCPANFGGALYFRQKLRNAGVNKKIWFAEFSSMMYACRKKSPSSVWVRGYKHNLGVAMFPQNGSQPAFDRLQKIYPNIKPYGSVIESGLSNMNTTLHTSLMLLNTASIDNAEDRLFYRECTTSSLDNLLDALERERMALNTIEGVNLLPFNEINLGWYEHQGAFGDTVTQFAHSLPIFAQSQMPTSMDHRYITEDVPYGLIPIATFLEQLGLDHEVHTSLINILCAVCNRDFYLEARTMAQLGIEGMNTEELMKYLETGC